MPRMLFTLILLTLCFFMGLQQPPATTESVVAVTMRRSHKSIGPQNKATEQVSAISTSILTTDTSTMTLTAGARFTTTLAADLAVTRP